jgi:NAD(P)-dependent dehydrogenase (short-subunit alcohol dehydrogenase family)
MGSDSLAGHRVLVTGGSHGIGREVARVVAAQGAHLLVAARGRHGIDAMLSELEGAGHRGISLDVSDANGWAGLSEELGAHGGLHGLVTAAAVIEPIGALGSYEPGDFWRTLSVNLYGTFLAIHHCLPSLEATGGNVVTFSGGGATAPLPRFDAYAASKAAVVRLTENVAAVAAERGVTVNCVAPGFVVTRMHEATLAAGPEAAGPDYFERTRRVVEGGGGTSARDAAELVAFLLSPQAREIRGKLISAQWDPWREDDFRERLVREHDFATLRRIDDVFFAATGEQR